MAIKRVVSRMPDPIVADLKSLVGSFARSRIFDETGRSLTQEQVVAICVAFTSDTIGGMSTEDLEAAMRERAKAVLGKYEAERKMEVGNG